MSLFSALMASVSGMNGEANMISTISDNIANSDTTGYKEANAAFESMLTQVSSTSYTAGGVATNISYGISTQGQFTSASSTTDMAINGNGFFVVENASGDTFLTRAGDFQPDVNGNLVNSEGYTLMGYPLNAATTASPPGSITQLSPIQISTAGIYATPSTSGSFAANLDSNSTVMGPGATPATATLATSPTASYTSTTTLTAYDDLGNPVTLNAYFTNLGGGKWEMDLYNGTPSATNLSLQSETLTFSTTTGALTGVANITPGGANAGVGGTSPTGTPSPTDLGIAIPNGQTLNLNLSGMTQLANAFAVSGNNINGNAPASYQGLSIGTDGTISEVYSNGTTQAIAKIPLATVESVNDLTPTVGQAYSANLQSGPIMLGQANTAGFGSINQNELESSTVDLATQLSNMVVAQNAYSCDSKAFQTASDMMTTLINMMK